MTNIANNLKKLRKAKKMSQEKVARLTDLTRNKISQYENGYSEPNLCTIIKLAEFYDTPIDFLIK